MKLSLFTVFFAGLRGPPALTLEALVDKAAELGCTSNWKAAISSVTPRAWSKT